MKWIKTFENFKCPTKSHDEKIQQKRDTEEYQKRRDEIDDEQKELEKLIPPGLDLLLVNLKQQPYSLK